jgi:hypothetical protein
MAAVIMLVYPLFCKARLSASCFNPPSPGNMRDHLTCLAWVNLPGAYAPSTALQVTRTHHIEVVTQGEDPISRLCNVSKSVQSAQQANPVAFFLFGPHTVGMTGHWMLWNIKRCLHMPQNIVACFRELHLSVLLDVSVQLWSSSAWSLTADWVLICYVQPLGGACLRGPLDAVGRRLVGRQDDLCAWCKTEAQDSI